MDPFNILPPYHDHEVPRSLEVDELLSNLAHHWRQPLNALSIGLQEIRELHAIGELDHSALQAVVSPLQNKVIELSKTIDLFRSAFGHHCKEETFDANSIVKSAIDVFLPRLENLHITLQYHLEEELPFTLEGDSRMLLQVLLALLENAVEALHHTSLKNRLIRIDTLPQQRMILITDHGCGIPKVHHERLFEPYFTTKFKSYGTGMGLYISQRIVKEYFGGSIRLDTHHHRTQATIFLPTGDPL